MQQNPTTSAKVCYELTASAAYCGPTIELSKNVNHMKATVINTTTYHKYNNLPQNFVATHIRTPSSKAPAVLTTMSLTNCRFYEEKYPEIDSFVMVNVKQIAEMGAYVKLLEYDNIDGMILLSELSRRRIRSIQKLIRVGRNEVVVVLRVDKEKGYIDLSKRRVSPEDIVKCEERYVYT